MAYTGTRYPRPARRPAFKERLWVRGTNGRIANWNGANVDRQSNYYAPLTTNSFGNYITPSGALTGVGNPQYVVRPKTPQKILFIRIKCSTTANMTLFTNHYEGIIVNGTYSPLTDWISSAGGLALDYSYVDPKFNNAAQRHTDRLWISFVNSIP